MAYHTWLYLFLFLPIALLLYQITPKKVRWVTLLLFGYTFFWLISGKLVIYLIGTSIFVYYIGLWLDKKKQKWVLVGAILVLLGVLGYLKYYNFFAKNMNLFFESMEKGSPFEMRKILVPIGISFYTLQAIGYLADVYWGKIKAELHLGKVALFLGFFPQIMEGPISMYSQTADDLWKGESIKSSNLSQGAVRILWGMLKKIVIADRLYVLVQAVFEHYENYSGIVVAAAAVAYTIQLYMEFSGSIDIVIGSGKMFGVMLPENFRQPFASKSAAEFWRRWHISLGAWFKAYVFYPVSLSKVVKKWNKFGKKHCGKYITKLGVSAIALFPVWFCNGLWHGPQWNYLFYGMYYFTILLAEVALEPARNKMIKRCNINENAFYWRVPQTLKTWVIIFVGELFFRANGLSAGLKMFKSIFYNFQLQKLWDGTFLAFGLDRADYIAIGFGCFIVAFVGMIKERELLKEQTIQKMRLPVRWALYYALILAVLIFGAYGVGYQQVDLIYAGF